MQELTRDYLEMFKNCFDIESKTSRSSFWMAMLVNFLIMVVISIIGLRVSVVSYVGGVYGLVVIIPFITITIRRLHDAGYSAKSLFWLLLPVLGWFYILLLLTKKSN